MGPFSDPEKEAGLRSTDPAHASTDGGDAASCSSGLVPEPAKVDATVSRHSSSGSSDSAESDLLEPVEHAADLGLDPGVAPLSASHTRVSVGSAASRPPDFEVVFGGSDDADNPRNWPLWYRSWVIFCVSYATWVVVLYSTSYTAAIPGVTAEYGAGSGSQTVATLGLATYLLGLAAGSVILAPLSELYGRRFVYLVCLAAFSLLIIPCGLATSLAEIIVVRFFG